MMPHVDPQNKLSGMRVRRTDRRRLARQYKDQPCADCGLRYPYYVMQFDHVRGDKEINVSRLINGNCSIERLLREIDKCDVVCANCHAIREHARTETTRELIA